MSGKKSGKKRILWGTLIIAGLYLLLLIPDGPPDQPGFSAGIPFEWNRDTYWTHLEQEFDKTRSMDAAQLDSSIGLMASSLEQVLSSMSDTLVGPEDELLVQHLYEFFAICPFIAAQPDKTGWLIDFYSRSRTEIKRQSQYWQSDAQTTRNTLYKSLYGMRAGVEEVMLQVGNDAFSPLMLGTRFSSSESGTEILGIPVQSGDLLLSRGGAAVSALISRGNDLPGNFSHVALIYIDDSSKIPSLIEAHIEKGVALGSVNDYISDQKLRVLVLRPRADLPQIIKDPLLPHKSAKLAWEETLSRHIAYDFKMNFDDSTAMFCSEVGSYAYRRNGIQLWQANSTISSPGTVAWLSSFGVENFVTQSPADLEYDPQLAVVGEWRDAETLFKDHLDNAVIDAMLEKADQGANLGYNHWKLPLVRLLKGYCWILNQFEKPGIIPEGMSATVALKNQELAAVHAAIKTKTKALTDSFEAEKNYPPPYWELIKLAKIARDEVWE